MWEAVTAMALKIKSAKAFNSRRTLTLEWRFSPASRNKSRCSIDRFLYK